MLLADEVEDGEAVLAVGQAQAAAELLQEDGRALGGTQEEHGVDLGDVDALVEEVDREDAVDLAARSIRSAGSRWSAAGRAETATAGMPAPREALGHVVGVRDADAEAERAHAQRVGDVVAQRAQRPSPARASLPV